MFSTSRKTKSVLPLPVLLQQMAVNGCLNGRTAVDLILSVGADVMVVVAVVVVVEFVVYSVSQERLNDNNRMSIPTLYLFISVFSSLRMRRSTFIVRMTA